MRQLNIFLLSAAAVTTGCTDSASLRSSEAPDMLAFEHTDSIEWHIESNGTIMPFPSGLEVADSSLYLLGLLDGMWLHASDIQSLDTVSSYINLGQGPEDLIQAQSFSVNPDGSVEIFDSSSLAYKIYDSDRHLSRTLPVADLFAMPWGVWHMTDGKYLVSAPTQAKESEDMVAAFAICDSTMTQALHITAENPDTDNTPLVASIPQGIALSPDNSRFASVTLRGGKLSFFSISDSGIKPEFSATVFPARYESAGNNLTTSSDSPFGFFDVCATDSVVIAAFSGTPRDMDCTKIGIWDWTGKPLRVIHTNLPIIKICIDSCGSTLYGAVYTDDNGPQIGSIRLD